MIDPEQLVQDVKDGSESPLVGFAVLSEEIERLERCRNEIEKEVRSQFGYSHKHRVVKPHGVIEINASEIKYEKF